jgi:hypothetical protein
VHYVHHVEKNNIFRDQEKNKADSQMPTLTNNQFNEKKSLAVFARLVETGTGLFCQKLGYHEVKRLLEINGDDVEAAEDGDDEIGEELVESLDDMSHKERVGNREVSIDMLGSCATLFDTGDVRKLKPTLHLVYNMRDDESPIVAAATCCQFTRGAALTTDSLPNNAQGVPRFNSTWLLIDAIHSNSPPAGSLLVVQIMLQAMRSKMRGVVAVAVSTRGRRLFEKMGFTLHNFRSDGLLHTLCWAECESLEVEDLAERMRLPAKMLETNCFRMGLTSKTSDRLISRCKQ